MSPPRLSLYAPWLLLALAASAAAQDNPNSPAVSANLPQGFDQAVYKGLVGSVLDAIPMDPSERLDLQRTNAVVSNTLFGRSLAILAGLSNPVLLVGGFVWGVWAASNIRPAKAGTPAAAAPGQSGPAAAMQPRLAARLDHASAVDNAFASAVPESILLSSISTADSAAVVHAHARVIKIWLPQRAPAPSRQ